jgi:magnesium transporter
LSLKDLLTTSTKTQIADIYIKKSNFVNVDAEDVEVAHHAKKRSRSIPVVDAMGN